MDSTQITCLAILLLSIVPFSFSSSLTLQLTHINQLNSKTENSIAPENNLLNRLNSDLVKVSKLSAAQSPSSASADLFSGLELPFGYAEYVAPLAIGSPAKDINLVLDLAGDVLWLQCEKCTNCYNQTTTIFDPTNSTSYSTLKCGDNICSQLHGSQASNCSVSDACLYNQTYGEDWYTSGEFSTETFTIGDIPVEKVAFGCGHDNEGLFDDTDGFLTLSRGPMSFVSQTEQQFGAKFSYCLASLTTGPVSNSSSITFGDAAFPPNTSTTPLVRNKKYWNYYAGLEAISVGGTRVTGFNDTAFDIKEDGKGGTIVDLIVDFTYLTTPVHNEVTKAFRKAMNDSHMTETPYPGFDTCYDYSNKMVEEMNMPSVELHFKDDHDLELPLGNYFTKIDYNGTHCLTFVSFPGNLSFTVLGNFVQQGIRVAFDLPNNRIGFTAGACT